MARRFIVEKDGRQFEVELADQTEEQSASERRIDNRRGMMGEVVQSFQRTEPVDKLKQVAMNPGSAAFAGIDPMTAMGAAGQAVESVPANILLNLIKGTPKNIPGDIKSGITGERPAEMGDVFAELGAPDPIANTLGLASVIGAGGLSKTAVKAGKELTEVGAEQFGRLKTGAQAALHPERTYQKLFGKEGLLSGGFQRKAMREFDLKKTAFQDKARAAREGIEEGLRQTTEKLSKQADQLQTFLNQASADDVVKSRPLIQRAFAKNRKRYSDLWDAAVEKVGKKPVNQDELIQFIQQEFGDDAAAADVMIRRLGLDKEAPTVQSSVLDVLMGKPTTQTLQRGETTVETLAKKMKQISGGISKAGKSSKGVATAADMQNMQMKGIIANYLEKKGYNEFSNPADMWRRWKPVQQNFKKLSPFLDESLDFETSQGSKLIQDAIRGRMKKAGAIGGATSVAEEEATRVMAALEREVGSLADDIRPILAQMDELERRKAAAALDSKEFRKQAADALRKANNQLKEEIFQFKQQYGLDAQRAKAVEEIARTAKHAIIAGLVGRYLLKGMRD